jgi:tetratricopeptide (TPR) repeat protein
LTAEYPDDLRAGGSGCPDAEQLAEYLDGTLDAPARDAIESHLVDCARCRTALAETAAFLSEETAVSPSPAPNEDPRVVSFPRSWWRAGAALALAAAAAVVIVARVAPQWLPRAHPSGTADSAQLGPAPFGPGINQPDLRGLIAAVAKEPTRPVEGRLTGGFPYGPPPVIRRGSAARDVSLDVRIAAADLEKALAGDPRAVTAVPPEQSAANAAALGVAYLITGEYEQAVRALEEAVLAESSNARFQSDLSAAYLARAEWLNKPDDWSRALTAADRAISLAPTMPEPYFNRALALDRLQRPSEARGAWEDYRARDGAGKWSQEALLREARQSRSQ